MRHRIRRLQGLERDIAYVGDDLEPGLRARAATDGISFLNGVPASGQGIETVLEGKSDPFQYRKDQIAWSGLVRQTVERCKCKGIIVGRTHAVR